MLASTMKKSNNQKPTSPKQDKQSRRRLMPQTPNSVPHSPNQTPNQHSSAVIRSTIICVPLYEHPMNTRTHSARVRVCSLERR